MNLTQWAIRHAIPFEALDELRREFGTITTGAGSGPTAGASEAAVQTNVRLEASYKGARLWRNNVGAFKPETGGMVRYGLCNDSPHMNRVIKSSDLIGLRPVVITQVHVGQTFGLFIARECKAAGWQYTGTDHEVAQLKFLELVAALGGDASFVTGEGTL